MVPTRLRPPQFFFTGVIHLLAYNATLQIYAGTIASLVVFLGTLATMPYKEDICDFVQLAVLLQLLFTYITASHLLAPPGASHGIQETGGMSDETTATLLVCVNLGAFFVILGFIVASMLRKRRARELEERRALSRRLFLDDHTEPALPELAGSGKEYHLFLSHSWGSGQDQMRIVKQKLLEMLPEVRVFLDVDDLKEGRGGREVELSRFVCVFVSHGYFISQNCMRELLRAVALSKPIITLLESEPSKGAISSAEVLVRLEHAETLFEKWNLDEEMRAAGLPLPSARELYEALNLEGAERADDFDKGAAPADEVVQGVLPAWLLGTAKSAPPLVKARSSSFEAAPALRDAESADALAEPSHMASHHRRRPYAGAVLWERIGEFQNVTMRLIGERLLGIRGTQYGRTAPLPTLQRPGHGLRCHAYCSSHNPGALAVLEELVDALGMAVSFEEYVAPRSRSAGLADRFKTSILRNAPSAGPLTVARRRWAQRLQRMLASTGLHEQSEAGRGQQAAHPTLHVTRQYGRLEHSEHMVLYLNRETWTRGLSSTALAHEVKYALARNVHVILVHEMPGIDEVGRDDSEARRGVEFDAFFQCADGATPEALLSAGVYNEIAIGLKGGAWRPASLVQLARVFAAGVEPREPPSVPKPKARPWARLRNAITLAPGKKKIKKKKELRVSWAEAEPEKPAPPPPEAPPPAASLASRLAKEADHHVAAAGAAAAEVATRAAGEVVRLGSLVGGMVAGHHAANGGADTDKNEVEEQAATPTSSSSAEDAAERGDSTYRGDLDEAWDVPDEDEDEAVPDEDEARLSWHEDEAGGGRMEEEDGGAGIGMAWDVREEEEDNGAGIGGTRLGREPQPVRTSSGARHLSTLPPSLMRRASDPKLARTLARSRSEPEPPSAHQFV